MWEELVLWILFLIVNPSSPQLSELLLLCLLSSLLPPLPYLEIPAWAASHSAQMMAFCSRGLS